MKLQNICFNFFKRPRYLVLASSMTMMMFISGCQQTATKQNDLSQAEQTQLKMLVSIVAGAKILKHQCQKTDIPTDDKLIKAVTNAAEDKGWNVTPLTSPGAEGLSKLQLANDTVYRQLSAELANDPDKLEERCEELNSMLSGFINVAKSL
ncbi:type II secretion system pilot lipoprotein GspS [Thorsellia anophelis]|uniref:Type II secretion system pilotin lipoprotein (PulS_OutS) n=1 Tax=Thorsellia anophelis DSM 18579 TaxID=1123402 RepID=A0A1I0AUJ9_9GAMM|nr:type II secretion system pilot lipoprotein GspS [Thorsellia anophelis]SES98093.1 Type II secretion system pilotin lipoprotein (PulS_OutS) [Thorsellia anophelis DSM 18579]